MRTGARGRALLRPMALAGALLLLLTAPASATSSDCAKAPNGSPCHTECLQDGQCLGGLCLGGHPVTNGTQCATGLICTTGDECVEGVCVPGNPVVCAAGPCGPEQCLEGNGCMAVNPCDMPPPSDLASGDAALPPPDLSQPIEWRKPDLVMTDANPPADAASPSDLGVPSDLPPARDLAVPATDGGVPPDDLGLPPDDLGVPPDLDPAAPDLSVADDGGDGDAAAPYEGLLHIHGSGCGLGRGSAPAPSAFPVVLLFAFGLFCRASRRRR